MQLGDFFQSAPYARPVNAREVRFTAVAKGKVLPGGGGNPHGRPVAATVSAAFVFLGGDGAQTARIEARQSLRKRFVDPDTKIALQFDDGDFEVELTYQILHRVLHEWDSEARTAGPRLFPAVENVRELVEIREANRLLTEYNKYVSEEHPEVLDDKPFRATDATGPRVVVGASR